MTYINRYAKRWIQLLSAEVGTLGFIPVYRLRGKKFHSIRNTKTVIFPFGMLSKPVFASTYFIFLLNVSLGIEQDFCIKTSKDKSQDWPEGRYCILKHEDCPAGLVAG